MARYLCWAADDGCEEDARPTIAYDAETAAAHFAEWYYERNAGDMTDDFEVIVKSDHDTFRFPISVGYQRYYMVGGPISLDGSDTE